MRYRAQRNYGCRIHDDYIYKNMRVVVLENEKIRVSILPDKGTEIYEFLYKPTDTDLMWLSSNGVQNPNEYLPTSPDPVSTFIDYYSGGWQEVFPNGGPPSTSLGATFGQHGEVAHMPWDYQIIEDSKEKITVEFSVRTKKTPFFIKKRYTLITQESILYMSETIENLSGVEIPTMWGQHITFGYPYLDEESLIEIPGEVKVIPHSQPICEQGRRLNDANIFTWPIAIGANGNEIDLRKLPEKGTCSEMLYLTGFELAQYKVVSPNKGLSVSVSWDKNVFPYLWFWQEFGAINYYPWYGRHYNIGLEPFSSMPTSGLEEAIKNGTALIFKGREIKNISMTVTVSNCKNENM